MKKAVVVLFCAASLLCINILSAQGFDWIKTAGDPAAAAALNNIEGLGVAADASGNTYVAGVFHDSTTFDTELLTTESEADGFIAKYNSAGAVQWVKQISNANIIKVGGIAADAAGNTYIVGNFNDTTDFNGTQVISEKSGKGWNPTYDFFVMSLDAAGATRWVQASTGQAVGVYSDVASNGTDVVIMAGLNGATSLGGKDLTKKCYLVAKVNTTDGTLDWATEDGTSFIAPQQMGGVAVDASGNVAVDGPSGMFGVTVGGTTVAGNSFFIAYYDNAGTFQWVKTATTVATVTSVAFDGAGKVYAGGAGTAGAVFDTDTLAATGGFVAKYGNDGTFAWVRNITGTGVTSVTALAGDPAKGVYAAGSFQIMATFDSGDSLTTTAAQKSSFLVSYSGNGSTTTPIAAAQSSQEVTVNAAAIDAAANVYLTGLFRIRVDWGDKSADASTNAGAGALPEMFVTKYNSTGASVDDRLTSAADALGLQVFPNPVTERFTISLKNSGNAVIRVLDMQGMEVPVTVENGTVALPQDIMSGAYLLDVTAGDTHAARKIFVK